MGNLKKGDIGVAAYVLAAFIMLIIPIKSGLLDVLLACNMAVAFTIMFGILYETYLNDRRSGQCRCNFWTVCRRQ